MSFPCFQLNSAVLVTTINHIYIFSCPTSVFLCAYLSITVNFFFTTSRLVTSTFYPTMLEMFASVLFIYFLHALYRYKSTLLPFRQRATQCNNRTDCRSIGAIFYFRQLIHQAVNLCIVSWEATENHFWDTLVTCLKEYDMKFAKIVLFLASKLWPYLVWYLSTASLFQLIYVLTVMAFAL